MRRLVPLFLLFALAASVAVAQSPRMVLVEEATNASCPPCAAQNPTFEHYLAQKHVAARVIPIVYHARWPGRDVMNAANATMHNDRIAYYGVSGVPTAMVNGKIYTKLYGGYDGAPSDTAAITRDISATPATSPITITIAENITGLSGTVDVTVSSTSALSNAKLRIALVEGYHYYANAGTNGEKEFPYTVRQMYPTQAGADLTLAAGTPQTVTHSITIDTSWNASEMYVVAFVQNDATKEVLQAGSDKLDLSYTASGATRVLNGAANEAKEFTGSVSTPMAGEYSVLVDKKLPAGWTAVVKINNVEMTPASKVSLQQGAPANVSVLITPVDSRNRRGSVTVTIKGPRGASVKESFRLYSRDITVGCYIRDEGVEQIATQYETAFEAGPYTFAMIPAEDKGLFTNPFFPVTMMETGKNVLERADVDFLKAYLVNGNRLFIAGAEIGWGLVDPTSGTSGFHMDKAFFEQRLHATYVSDDNPSTVVKGVAGDPIGNGFNVNFTEAMTNQDTPDEIAPRDGAVPIFTYANSATAVAGIRYEGADAKIVYLGFGLEGIRLTATRAEIIKRGVAWLLGVAAVDEASSTVPRVHEIYPNPAGSRTVIPVTLDRAARVRIALYDALGRFVSLITDGDAAPGSTQFAFDASALAAGTYLLHVDVGGAVKTKRLVVR